MQHGQRNKTMDDFQDWIRALHVGLRKFEALFDRLTIYEHKLVSGPSSNLKEPIKQAVANYNPFLHWIVKIEETKEQLGDLQDIILDYDALWKILLPQEQALLSNLITRKLTMTQLALSLDISRTHLYTIRNDLYQKWVNYFQNK